MIESKSNIANGQKYFQRKEKRLFITGNYNNTLSIITDNFNL